MSSVNKKHQATEDVVDGHTISGKSTVTGKDDSRTKSHDIKVLETLIQEVSGVTEENRKKALEEYRLLKVNYEEVRGDPTKYVMFTGLVKQKNIKESNRTQTLKRNAFYLAKILDLAAEQLTGNQKHVEEGWAEFVLLLNADYVYKFMNQTLQTSSFSETIGLTSDVQSRKRSEEGTKCVSPGDRYSKSFTQGDTPKDQKMEATRKRQNSERVKPLGTGQISYTKDEHVTTIQSPDKMPDLHVNTTRTPDQEEDSHAGIIETTDQQTDLYVGTTKTTDPLTNLNVGTTKTTDPLTDLHVSTTKATSQGQGADMHVSTSKTTDKWADGELVQQEGSHENMDILQDDRKFQQDLEVPQHKHRSLEILLHDVKDSIRKERGQREYRHLVSYYEATYGPDSLQKSSSGCDNIEIQDVTPDQRDVAPELYNILARKEKTENENLTLAVVQYLKLTEHYSKTRTIRPSGRKTSHDDPKDGVYGASAQAISSSSFDKPRSKGHEDKKSYILHILICCKSSGMNEEMDNLRNKAMREYQRLHHCEQLLLRDYPLIESSRENESNVRGPEEILDHQSAPKLFNFLRRVDREYKGYVEAWREYDMLLQSEQLLIMAQITNPKTQSQVAVKPQTPVSRERDTAGEQAQVARCKHGAITNSHVLLPRTTLEELKHDLRRKDEQINDLTTRLSRYASQLLLDNNPNIADLSDKNRPSRLGDKFGILYDDQWSEAFEAVSQSKSLSGDDDVCEDILELLQRIVMTCFSFCQQETRKQFEKVKNSMTISFIVGDEPTEKEMADDVAKELSQFTTRQTKSCMISAAGICHKKAAKVFCDKVLPSILEDKHLQTEAGMVGYVEKCVELCWYMCVQDPPMTVKCPKKGEKINLSSYAYHNRKGKVVQLCVWPALFLYEGGPLVKKGFILPS